MKREAWARWGALGVVASVGLFVEAAVHVEHLGEDALVESDRAMASGDATTAIARARDAAMARSPWSSVPDDAFERLQKIGEEAESRGDFEHAEEAWRAVRTALRATRREADEPARMEQAGTSLLRLSGRVCEADQSHPAAVCSAATRAALARDDLPPVARFSWLGIGALAFLGGGAAGLRAPGRRARVAGSVVAFAGVAVATLDLALR